MGMVVRTNTMAINAFRQLGSNNNAVAKSLEKLSSGFRINRAGDDASGLAISEKMKAQITGLEQASVNAQDGISLVQTAEGNLAEVHSMLNRMVELAMKSANGILEDKDRKALQDEMNQLADEIDRIADSANFNNRKLFNGSMSGPGNTGNNNNNGLMISDPEITFNPTDTTANAAGLKDVGFTFADGLDDTVKDAFNKALGENGVDLTIDVVEDTVGNDGAFGDDDVIKISGLPTGYKLMLGTKDVTTSGVKYVTANPVTNNGEANLGTDFTVNIVADDGTVVGALKIETGNGVNIDESSTVHIGQAGPAAATAAADDAGNADADKAVFEADISGWTTNLQNNQSIKIGDKEYKVVTGGGADTAKGEIDGDTVTDIADQVEKALELYNADDTATFTAELSADKQTITFTAKEAGKLTDADVPEVSANGDAATTKITNEGTDGNNNGTNATAQGGLKLQIGDSNYDYDKMEITMNDMHMDALFNDPAILNNLTAAETKNPGDIITKGSPAAIFGPDPANDPTNITVGANSLNIATQDNAAAVLQSIRGVIEKVSDQRGALGAIQNRLEHTINNLDVAAENMNAANSRIRDTDMAKEMMQYTKMNVLVQSAQAMLAQANQQPQSILQLLQ